MECKKIVTLKVICDSEETWAETLDEVQEILNMMNNLKRKAEIVGIESELKI